jgi:uncharacterized protein YegP (UPF0339 family)
VTTGKYEMFLDKAGEHRFNLKAPNGQIIGQSQGYNEKQGCLDGIESVRKNAAEAELVELTEAGEEHLEFAAAAVPQAKKVEEEVAAPPVEEEKAPEVEPVVEEKAPEVEPVVEEKAPEERAAKVSGAEAEKGLGGLDMIWGLIGVLLAIITLAVVLMIMF